MFLRKKTTKTEKKRLVLFIKNNEDVLFQGLFQALPLKEALIIQKSIEFFDDETPCYIHKSAVRNRLLAELEEVLCTLPGLPPVVAISDLLDIVPANQSYILPTLFCTYTGFPAECTLSLSIDTAS